MAAGWWVVVIVVRWLCLLWPQPGYIHPDEFFQSVEVVSGDVFTMEVHKTWEFTGQSPLRSTFLPCLLYWPAYWLLKLLTAWGVIVGGTQGYLSTSSLLLAPRIVIGILGTLVDVLVHRTLKLYKGYDVDSGMWMYLTSYVSLVYYTRTFSNTLEAFLFVMLVYVVQVHIKHQERYDNLNPRSKMTVSTRIKEAQVSRLGGRVGYQTICTVSIIIVAGVFNRPTFVLFTYVPYLCWLCDGQLPKDIPEFIATCRSLTVRIHQTLFAAIFPAALFILWDSAYYGRLGNLEAFSLSNWKSDLYNSFVMTPLNFATYNTKSDNLAQHGTHSRWTHVFVNIPLLFGPVCIWLVYDIFTFVLTRGYLGLKRTAALDIADTKFWIYTLIIPVILLSIFPHQEPRFLIPLLLPVCVLYSHLVFGKKSRIVFKALWMLLNISGFIFYGFLHQGGVVKVIDGIKMQTLENVSSQRSHVIFSHTYMPPKHLFTIKSSKYCLGFSRDVFFGDKTITSFMNYMKCGAQPKFIDSSKLKLYDLKGRPLDYVEEKVKTIKKFQEYKQEVVYLVAPSSFEVQMCVNKTENQFDYIYQSGFTGHLSMEETPGGEFWKHMNFQGFPRSLCEHNVLNVDEKSQMFESLLSLNVYEVVPKR